MLFLYKKKEAKPGGGGRGGSHGRLNFWLDFYPFPLSKYSSSANRTNLSGLGKKFARTNDFTKSTSFFNSVKLYVQTSIVPRFPSTTLILGKVSKKKSRKKSGDSPNLQQQRRQWQQRQCQWRQRWANSSVFEYYSNSWRRILVLVFIFGW